jgi:hypothetical protein
MKELLTPLLCLTVLSAAAQYQPQQDFKQVFKQHMLTPTEQKKPKLTFEQRDVLHHNLAGGILAAIGIPVVTHSALEINTENVNMAATGLAFGGAALVGSIVLHTLGINKLIRYKKEGKLPPKL